MFHFLETNIREQKKYEKTIQTFVDNTVNDLRYKYKFENRVKGKNNFFIKWNIPFWTKIYFILRDFLKFLKFFLPRQISINIGIPRQKPWHLPTAEANFENRLRPESFRSEKVKYNWLWYLFWNKILKSTTLSYKLNTDGWQVIYKFNNTSLCSILVPSSFLVDTLGTNSLQLISIAKRKLNIKCFIWTSCDSYSLILRYNKKWGGLMNTQRGRYQ